MKDKLIPSSWDPAKPITAEGGPLDRGSAFREIAALYPNGRFVVSRSHMLDANVQSLLAEVRLLGIRVLPPEPVDLVDVAACYAQRGELLAAKDADIYAPTRRQALDLFARAAALGAAAIHIAVGDKETTVRARVDGLMRVIDGPWPTEYGHKFCAACFSMADAADTNYMPNQYQGARINKSKDVQLPPSLMALRLQFNPTAGDGRALIIRLFYTGKAGVAGDVTALGFSPTHLHSFERLRAMPYGLIIVAGPTGHGKSTTLVTNIRSIIETSAGKIAVYTVEDPPEYPIDGAVQLPVTNARTLEQRAEAFTAAISAMLRSNPDRCMIGEVRDRPSAQLAFEAAMTGHQCWTTLHGNNASALPYRLLDLGVEMYKIADPSLLTGLVSQRLIRTLCPVCAQDFRAVERDLSVLMRTNLGALAQTQGAIEALRFHNPEGCERCRGRGNPGYAHRSVVGEIIVPDEEYALLVASESKVKARHHWLTTLGGSTMEEHAIQRCFAGDMDPRDAQAAVGVLEIPTR